jgi:aryl-alcohol dehydrogenase-like predicted oxidoreductase
VRSLGLGLAAVGRPGYITLGRGTDLPEDRSVGALRARTHELLDQAYAAGVRYADAARSYGRAEEFLAEWLRERGIEDVVVGSKWGYTYTAGWRVDADVHEVKDHSLATYERQVAESRQILGAHLNLYLIHSVTPDSPALTDPALHARLAELARTGITVGLSTSGPSQRDAIRAAMTVTVDGAPLFGAVQATWNPLEQSAAPALAEAHAAGYWVVVKEALANGRLAGPANPTVAHVAHVADELSTTPDVVALAAALHQPWATVVLSGAATTAQLASNLRAAALTLDPDILRRLLSQVEPAPAYWHHRSTMPWS